MPATASAVCSYSSFRRLNALSAHFECRLFCVIDLDIKTIGNIVRFLRFICFKFTFYINKYVQIGADPLTATKYYSHNLYMHFTVYNI